MSLRSGTQKYGDNIQDVWITDGGYNRNLALEEKIARDLVDVRQYDKEWKSGLNPERLKLPSWWDRNPLYTGIYGWEEDGYTPQEAINYLEDGIKILTAKINDANYRCSNYPRDTYYCQNSSQFGGEIGNSSRVIKDIKEVIEYERQKDVTPTSSPFEAIPQVFAEEDPSINSGLNGNESESEVINYPQSANVRIIISNISMFSTSIPINDISQLQILSNEFNEWRYTLIGTSTNQPLMTLSGLITKINSMIASAVVTQPPVTQPPVTQPPVTQPPVTQPPVITTVHVTPPDIALDPSGGLPEVPITVTPTEPGQVNWIPEPFFSIINSVFRK